MTMFQGRKAGEGPSDLASMDFLLVKVPIFGVLCSQSLRSFPMPLEID